MKRKYTQQEVERLMVGRLYCNPNDKNIFVRRRGLAAWTMNLGNPWAWCITGAAALVICLVVWALN